MKRQLIITADDFGFSKERNRGVIEAFQNAAVKSASLLLNCTGTPEGVELIKQHQICAGLHLNLTEGSPINQESYSTLTNADGKFWGMFGLREKLEESKVDLSEIRREIQCQIDQFLKLVGRRPVYVDGHQHIHVHPAVSEIFASTLSKNGILATRFPVEISVEQKEWLKPGLLNFLMKCVGESKDCQSIFDSHGLRYSNGFVGLSTMGANMTSSRLQSAILRSFTETEKLCDSNKGNKGIISCELMTHPGYSTPEDAGGFDWWTDDFGSSLDREYEIRVLSSKEMSDFYKENDIHVVSHAIL